MTNLSQLITELKEKAAKATPEFEVSFPPDDYSGDWDLLHCPRRRFESLSEANEFAESKKNKRVPDYGQPFVREISPPAFELAPETILALCEALEEAREVVEFYSILECEPVFGFEVNTTSLTKKARAFLAKYFPKGA